MKISLSEAFTYLLSAKKRDFYARIINALIRVEVQGAGTIGVGISRDGKYILYYDPIVLEKISFQKLVLMLHHEIYHLILGHIPRYLDLISGLVLEEEKRRFKAAMNISADCAANELLRSEPGFDETSGKEFYASETTDGYPATIPETFGLERNKPFEVYLFQLLANMKKTTHEFMQGCKLEMYSVPAPGAGADDTSQNEAQSESQDEQQTPEMILSTYFNDATGGGHRFWTQSSEKGKGEGEGEDDYINSEEMQGLADKLRQEGENIIRVTVQEQLKSRGTVPAHLKEYIDKLLAEPTIPWPRVLRDICKRTQQSKRVRGMRRPSRRLYGVPGILPFPGQTRDFKFTVAFAIDTSGSMNVDDLKLALRELLNLVRLEQDISLTVIYCDAEIHAVYEVTKEEDVGFNITGRGGTDFNPIFVKTRELLKGANPIDLLVVATDGYCDAPRPENRVPIPVIWLTTPQGQQVSTTYGITLRMEPF